MSAFMMFLILFYLNLGAIVMSTCSDSLFIGCVIRLKSQGAPFGRNMMKVVFDVETEAKLIHTCKVYAGVLPCFAQKINECGDTKQKRLMKEVDSIFMFLCSPFSLQRQSLFLEHRECISSTMNKAQKNAKCDLTTIPYGEDVLKCKNKCSVTGQADIVCMVNSWVSEQNACTLNEIRTNCGDDAADFYQSIQRYVFDSKFPIVCEEFMVLEKENNKTTSLSTSTRPTTTSTTTTTTMTSAAFIPKKKEEKSNSKHRKNLRVVQAVPTTTTETTPNVSMNEYYQMPMRKDSENVNDILNTANFNAKPVETSYKIFNSLRAAFQANMSPQLVDMFRKTSNTFKTDNADINSFIQNTLETSTSFPSDTNQYANNLSSSEQHIQLFSTSTTASSHVVNGLSGGSKMNNTSTLKKTLTITKPYMSMTKWRPWYLDGN